MGSTHCLPVGGWRMKTRVARGILRVNRAESDGLGRGSRHFGKEATSRIQETAPGATAQARTA
jgi:hypothetical protein